MSTPPIASASSTLSLSPSSPSSFSSSSVSTSTSAPTSISSSRSGSKSNSDPFLNLIKSMGSGALAGAVSRTVTSPLERLKVMKQVQAKGDQYHGIIAAFRKMYVEEGFKGYFKGNGTNVARIAPFSAIQFFSFDVYKRFILPEHVSFDANETFVRTLTAGALTGLTASTICYPLDLVRSVLSVQTTSGNYQGIGGTMVSIVRVDGLRGLYRGLTPTLMGIAPYVAINMTTFDLLKSRYLPDRNHPYFNVINLMLGACAGFSAAGLTYPTDVVRRRMQLVGMKGVDLPQYSGTVDCVKTIVREEGVQGLYKGMIPCFLKVVPSMAIAFMLYEALRKQLKFDPPSSKPPSGG